MEVLAIHEQADEDAFRIAQKVRREHKRVREIPANTLLFEIAQRNNGRATPLVRHIIHFDAP